MIKMQKDVYRPPERKKEEPPKTAIEIINKEIEEWDGIRKEYYLLQKQSSTHVEYHSLQGGIRLIKDFITSLKDLKKEIKKLPDPTEEQAK